MEGEEDLADFVAAAMEASDDEDSSNALVNSIAQGNRKEGGPPQWQSQYDLMNAHSCAPDRLPACLFDVITLPSQKQNSDGTFSAEEFAGVHSLPCTSKKQAMKACFQLVHDSLSPYGLDTMVSSDEKSLSFIALEQQNEKADEATKKKNALNVDEYPSANLKEKKKSMREQAAIALSAEFGPTQKRPGNNANADFSRVIKFCCRRCYCVSIFHRTTAGATRYCQVAEGRTHFFSQDHGLFVCYIVMTKVWFHDKNCTAQKYNKFEDLVHRRPTGSESADPIPNTFNTMFDHEKVFKGAFDQLIHHIDTVYDNPLVANPPGVPINFGIENYTADDRRNEFMPSEQFVEQISFMNYHQALVRFTYTWICQNDLCYQFTNEFSQCQYPPIPEPTNSDDSYGNIIRLCYSSVIHGGHNIDQTGAVNADGKRKKICKDAEQNKRNVVHQLCHIDIPPVERSNGVFVHCSDNEDTLCTLASGSIIVPLQDTACIYIKNTDYWRIFEKGEAFYFPGDVPHGGETIAYKAGEPPHWNLRLHMYVINQDHEFQWNKLSYYTSADSYLPPEHIALVDTNDLEDAIDKYISNLEMIAAREQDLQQKKNTKTLEKLQGLCTHLEGCKIPKKK